MGIVLGDRVGLVQLGQKGGAVIKKSGDLTVDVLFHPAAKKVVTIQCVKSGGSDLGETIGKIIAIRGGIAAFVTKRTPEFQGK